MKATTEQAFEAYIEETLLTKGGWYQGTNREWDKKVGVFPERVLSFIKETQKELYSKMAELHGKELDDKIIETLLKERNTKGTIHILRHGFRFFGKTFNMAYFKPAHGLNPEIIELYEKNQLTVTRQVQCHITNYDTVDLVFSINGLPIATCELKNPATGQNWKNAIAQYRKDRDWRMPLFKFKTAALVHFAADPDEIHMTTHLRGNKTFFLPFNRGSHPGEVQCGAGNPQHSSGHRTGYFWEEILQKDSFLEIVGSFIFIETKEEIITNEWGKKKQYNKETVIFPRYHQLDAVRELLKISKQERTGHNYLIQHSAGSGKTNSISWLSHRLASLHTNQDEKIFDCIVVITDRKVLDKQLQDAIYQIEHAQGVVKAIDQDAKQLAEALIDGTKIVITTLQKFPFVLKGLLKIAGAENTDKATEEQVEASKNWQDEIAKRNYAIIVDEAHSSQTGETARELKEILGTGIDLDIDNGDADWEDRLNQVMESRGKQKNISFFAFTATPKGKTLQLFGRNNESFHVYSMRQAIQEGFILNVLENYTVYETFYKLIKSVEDDPELPQRQATKALGRFMSLHPVNVEQRTQIMVEHYRSSVKHRINGKAKAMLVTSSRLHAVKYMLAFERYIEKRGYTDIKPLVAFSGKVQDPDTGLEYTEPQMNTDVNTGKPISESQLSEKFDTDDYQILLVANKYQTGFDQPLLHTMYVDKPLDGVQAVQTLSRLNRISPGKETPFVLDFVNSSESIYKAFKPYYDQTSLQEDTDPQLLETLKHELNAIQVYYWSEVEAFAQVFYKALTKQNPTDHARMQKHIQPAVDRYKTLDEKLALIFKHKLSAFIKSYAFLSQIIPYNDSEMEILYSFCRFLQPHLPRERDYEIIRPEDEVSLQYYRIERVSSGSIVLEEGEPYGVKGITEAGTGGGKEPKKPLSEIIEVLNSKFGTEFSEEDRLFFEQIREKAVKDKKIIQTAEANPLDKFQLGIKKIIENLMIQRMSENDDIVSRYMEDLEFQNDAYKILAKEIYEKIINRY
ncbi:DEAD/DEAH box helicase family protein [Seonamhaeicola sp.]|uniref:type I restriction endonuclease subunit R n=1 Tax=Seonamhaeicola sp. TaxID=1912245 RepID=UPI00262C2BAB|nr:DEAD/DEAH box helicase family protein [Seonamhaeicola sp.]